jgi:uncharacterized protein (TIGR02271 family)
MTRTITALFDSRQDADKAKMQLASAGVSNVNITAQGQGYGDATTSGTSGGLSTSAEPVKDVSEGDYGRGHDMQGGGPGGGGGLWHSIKNMFSDEDRPTYEEGMRRGHFLLTAQVDDQLTDEAIRILENSDAVDVDQRAQEWKSSGWTGGAATAGMATGGVAGHVGDDRVTGHHGDDQLRGASSDDELRLGETDRLQGATTGTNEAIPVVQENLVVGKREVERGGVRVRSYVVEQPVHEQVRLHEEHVSVERRPVNQPLSAATDGDLFRERTIEVTEHAEEAVVAKEARVVEELVVRKEAEERTETISDTVRHTEVEVDRVGENRAFTAQDTDMIPGETDEERRLRLSRAGTGTSPQI